VADQAILPDVSPAAAFGIAVIPFIVLSLAHWHLGPLLDKGLRHDRREPQDHVGDGDREGHGHQRQSNFFGASRLACESINGDSR